MSSVASSRSMGTKTNWGRVALAGLAAIFAAIAVNVPIYFVGRAFVAYNPEFAPLADVIVTVITTTIYTAAAALVYALVLHFSRNPVRTYLIVAVIALVVTLIPDFTYIPTERGSSAGQTAILVLMHILPAPVIVYLLTTLAHPRRVQG